MPRARPKLEIRTVAPCSWATLATAKPIELSMVTPVTRIRLPSRMPPMSVPHSESAVDRDDCPGDVASIVRGEPRDGVRVWRMGSKPSEFKGSVHQIRHQARDSQDAGTLVDDGDQIDEDRG